MITRRRFLKGVAAASALVACGDDEGRFGRFTVGMQTWTFRAFDRASALDQIARLGLTRVELTQVHMPYPATDDEIAALEADLAARGLSCLSYGPIDTSADHDANRAGFLYARALGLRMIMVNPPAEALDSLEALVAEFDIRIGIHNHGPGSRYNLIADVEAAIDGRDPRMGCLIDTGHYLRAGEDPVAAIRRFEGRVFGLHLKDTVAAAADAPDAILGAGVLDLDGVMRALRDTHLPADASLSIEYEANLDPYADLEMALDAVAAASRA